MNILIINQPLNNRGDESAHRGFVRRLRNDFPCAKIQVLFVSNEIDSINQFRVDNSIDYVSVKLMKGYSRLCKNGFRLLKSIPLLWYLFPTIRKQLKSYRQADYIICAPGGICMGGFQNWEHLFHIYLAKYFNKPLAYYGRSIGPFPTSTESEKKFKKLSMEMLNYFSYLSIRDNVSSDLATELGIKHHKTLDSAFLDAPKVDIPAEINLKNEKYVVFVPNLLIWHHAYRNRVSKEQVIDFFKRILDCLLEKYPSHNIIMLPQTFNNGTYVGDDILFFKDIKSVYNDERIIVLPDTYSSDIQQTIISQAELMVGARYHSVVFALNNNTPFIALSYEHKIAGLLQVLGKEDCMIDITSVFDSEQTINNAIDKFINMLESSSKDESAMNNAKKIADKAYRNFVKLLN